MKKRALWMVRGAPRPSAPGIPCGLASLARVPLRFAKGTFAQHPERVRDHSIFAAFPVALPLWIPAFAGMTGVVQRSRRGRAARR